MAALNTGVPHFPPGTKVSVFGREHDGPVPDSWPDRAVKSGTVTKGGTVKFDGLKQDTRYWLVGDTEDRGQVVVRAVAR